MPFREVTRMQNRRELAVMVLSGQASITQASRVFGVSRPTAYLWVERAREQGLAFLSEESRRPHHIVRSTAKETEAAVLAQKAARPAWGAKKIHATLWPDRKQAPICVRTVDRILARNGLVGKRGESAPLPVRFEREGCNDLWQMDFKGMGPKPPFWPLSVIDDCSRFCLALKPLRSASSEAVWSALWEVFGEYGLPECILSDNGDCFNSTRSLGPTPLQARLWRAGIKTTHGRPAHPQTQGKVERLHRTLEDEYRELLYEKDELLAEPAWRRLREDYNWSRPHEALEMRTPGSQYRSSPRKRPDTLPPADIGVGAISRKVDAYGKFYFLGNRYRAGRGLAGEYIEIREVEDGYQACYANVAIGNLDQLQV
jgi:transposase InsO family protein